MKHEILKFTTVALLAVLAAAGLSGCAASKSCTEEHKTMMAQIERSNREAAQAAESARQAARDAAAASERADRAVQKSEAMFTKSLHK
jgi:hypothetical protein